MSQKFNKIYGICGTGAELHVFIITIWAFQQCKVAKAEKGNLASLAYRVVICVSETDGVRKQSSSKIQAQTLNIV